MDVKKEVGFRIREARQMRKMTLKRVAEKTGDLKVARISNFEQGRRMPGLEEIKQLASALDVSVSYLLCIEEKEWILSPAEMELLKNYRACDDRGRQIIAQVAALQPTL
jgi:transcriptional regulator with XRE-family HTH domain